MNKIYLAIIGIVAVLGMGVMFLADNSSAEDIEPQADERTVVKTFNIGVGGSNDVVATLYDDGDLVITGDGEEIMNFSEYSSGPFQSYWSNLKKITFNAPNLKILGEGLFGTSRSDNWYTNITTIDWGNSPIEVFKYRTFQAITSNTHIDSLPDTLKRVEGRTYLKATVPEHLVIPENCEYIALQGLTDINGLKTIELPQKCHNGIYSQNGGSYQISYAIPSTIETVIIYGNSGDIDWMPTNTVNNCTAQFIPNVTKIILKDVHELGRWQLHGISPSKIEYDVDGTILGWYSSPDYSTSVDITGANTFHSYLMVAKANVDPAYNVDDETFNFENVTATMNVSGTDYDLVPEYAIYPTDYITVIEGGMAGKLIQTIPVFVALALLMGIVVAVRSRMD